MFDLEAQIRAWRQALAKALGDRKEVLDELESHLREEMQRLVLNGLSSEQAYESAVARLGTVDQLTREFGKVPTRPGRWLPGLIVAGLYGAGMVVSLALMFWFRGERSVLLFAHVATVLAGYTAVFAFGALAAWGTVHRAWGGWDLVQAESMRWWASRYALLGLAMTFIGAVLGSIWARDHVGAYWTNDPREFGGLAVMLTLGLTVLVLQRGWLAGRAELLLGLMANLVVAWAWFVATAMAATMRGEATEETTQAVMLKLFFLAHGVLFLLALLPPRSKDAMTVERTP